MPNNTWIAAGAGNASVDANWSLGHKPTSGEDVTFDGTSTNNCNWDVAVADLGAFTLAVGYSGTVTQAASFGVSLYSQASGTFTGNALYTLTTGPFSKTGGTLSPWVLDLKIVGSSTISATGGLSLWKLSNTGTATIKIAITAMNLYNSGSMSIDSGIIVSFYPYYAGYQWAWTGSASGLGILQLGLETRDASVQFSNVTCAMRLAIIGGVTPRTINLLGDSNCSAIGIGTVGTPIITFNLNGHQLISTGLTSGAKGIISSSVPGATVNAASVMASAGAIDATNIKRIRSPGNVDLSGGWTPGACVVELNGAAQTLKLPAASSVAALVASGAVKLLSDVAVSGILAHVNPIDKGGFALTLTDPTKEYTGLRRPTTDVLTTLGGTGMVDSMIAGVA
jgi:hypothetical protein